MPLNETQDYKISLTSAIFININIMLGAGIFINTSTLAGRSGAYGALMYVLVGILMFPLILSIASLLKVHPAGGFYTFAKCEIHPFAGFLSGWSYFTAKLASCMLMIHVSVTLLQQIFPGLKSFHPFFLDSLIIGLFILLNLLNIKAGSAIQKMFIGFKTFPLFFAIASGIFLFNGDNLTPTVSLSDSISSSLPLVIYAVIGFEAACSISSKIKDAKKNAPLAVLISFVTVILIATLYQTIFYGALGEKLAKCIGHCDTFPALIHQLLGETPWSGKLEGVLHLAIASSTLGAAYGIIFSNSWNLHVLAENNHLIFSRLFSSLNTNAIPYLCVVVEGVICLIYLLISQGVLVPLQQIGALGCVLSYTISVASLFFASKKSKKSLLLPTLGLFSCSLLITACIRCFFDDGMSSLVTYSTLILVGISMFFVTSRAALQSKQVEAKL